MQPYYRIELEDYSPVSNPVSMRDFVEQHKEGIADELSQSEKPLRYPFVMLRSGDVRTVQGGYLTRCTPVLARLILDAGLG